MFPKPKIIVSKCLEFENCRYDGGRINDQFILNLKKFVNFEPVCPEVAIGLGTPRDPIRLITIKGIKTLYQPSTDKDLTEKMENFSESYLRSINEVDGFILKRGSPSCGTSNVKMYTSFSKPSMPKRGVGLFAEKVFKFFPLAAIEDESRLNNNILREHFLTKLFTNTSFREIKKNNSLKQLIEFHKKNQILFFGHSPEIVNELENIIKNDNDDVKEILNRYELTMSNLFNSIPKSSLMTSALRQMYNILKDKISSDEKAFFITSLAEYENGIIPLSSITRIIQSWAIRFNNDYLIGQTLFEPFPNQLIKNLQSESGKELKPINPVA